jgi:hypothetical protein
MRINLMVLLLISLTVLVGCSRISVYVLDQSELVKVRSGETITAKYDGWLLSQRAVDRVMNAKIKGVNLQ